MFAKQLIGQYSKTGQFKITGQYSKTGHYRKTGHYIIIYLQQQPLQDGTTSPVKRCANCACANLAWRKLSMRELSCPAEFYTLKFVTI